MEFNKLTNPFVTIGYRGPDYFCDREKEAEKIMDKLSNGNNIVLLAHRRMGKTGLISHCVTKYKLFKDYNVFIIDILATKNIKEFTLMLADSIVDSLKHFDEKALDTFLKIVSSIQVTIAPHISKGHSIKVQYTGIPKPEQALVQIFDYIQNSKKPCILAIDEFQQIEKYPENNIEALLRTLIQKTPESRFIFAGSARRTMGRMFTSENNPFYQSATPIFLDSIPLKNYSNFIKRKFIDYGKDINEDVIAKVYGDFKGITWYIQRMMNEIFTITIINETATIESYENALNEILASFNYIYEEILYKIPAKQKELLVAIAKEGEIDKINSGAFGEKYKLSQSTIQSAKKGLLAKEYITEDLGKYYLYDKFFELWINNNL